MLGNFLGDFVKGRQYLSLPEELQHGVLLHRKIDQFTDQHPFVSRLASTFPKHLRRMAGVALDIYFDHLLVQHWQRFNQVPLQDLLSEFYLELESCEIQDIKRYQGVRASLVKHRWLADYQEPETCLQAFYAIERRLNHRVSFAEGAWKHIANELADEFEAFPVFYRELVDFVQSSGKQRLAPN